MGGGNPFPAEMLRGVHVLVVDDDADARELVGTVLSYCGALVTAVESASDALAALDRVIPDVLVSDISMPGRDGYWLVDQVRHRPPDRGGTIPAVAVTALGDRHGPDRTRAVGFQAHMRKPIDGWQLCEVIRGLLST